MVGKYSQLFITVNLRKFKTDTFIKDFKTILSKSFDEEAISWQALGKSVNVTLEKYESKYSRMDQAKFVEKTAFKKFEGIWSA